MQCQYKNNTKPKENKMRINLTTTKEEKDIVKAAGAKWDGSRWSIDESQKSNPVFAPYLPKDLSDAMPPDEWAGDTEKQIYGSMNSKIPNPFNHIKTYTDPEPEKDFTSGDVPSPEILEPVNAEISPEISSPEKTTKRTRGQIIDAEDSKIKKTYALSLDAISRCDRISKHFHMNLSSTIEKALKIAEQWIEENSKDAEIKKKDLHNEQLLEVIRKNAKFEEMFDKQNREIEALKTASPKNSGTEIKNYNIQNDVVFDSMQKTITKLENEISALKTAMTKNSVADLKNSNNSNSLINNDIVKRLLAKVEVLKNWTAESLELLDERTGPMNEYFKDKKGWDVNIREYEVKRNKGQITSIQLPDELDGGI